MNFFISLKEERTFGSFFWSLCRKKAKKCSFGTGIETISQVSESNDFDFLILVVIYKSMPTTKLARGEFDNL